MPSHRDAGMSEAPDFDMQAAWLRRFRADAEGNLRAFALRLREAMPDAVTIRESRSFFARTSNIIGVAVRIGDHRYTLDIEGGRLCARVAMEVRGIVISNKAIDPADWFARLMEETRHATEHAATLSRSLADFMAG